MCRSPRRSSTRLLPLTALAVLFAAANSLPAQTPATPVAARSAIAEPHDTADLYGSLRDVINYGAELFNKQADHAGCYRVYQGALISMRPFLAPAIRKQIDASIHRAEALPYYSERAFELRRTLDDIRARSAPGKNGAPTGSAFPVASGNQQPLPSLPKVETPKVESKIEPANGALPKIVEAPKTRPMPVGLPPIEAPKLTPIPPATKKIEAPKVETPKIELPKLDPSPIAVPKIETPKKDPLKIEAPQVEAPKIETPRADPLPIATPKIEVPKIEAPKIETPKTDPLKIEAPKIEAPKIETPKDKKVQPPPIDLNIPAPIAPVPEKKVESAKADLPKLDPLAALPAIDAPKEKKVADKGQPKGALSGIAMLDGKPLPPGFFVTLVSTEGKRYSTIVQKEGNYRFTLGIPVGSYRVVVEPVSADAAKKAAVPPRYRDESTSGLTIQIVAGQQTHDLRLTK